MTGPTLEVRGLDLDAPGGRPLLRSLSVSLGREKVAMVGRNGVGKSTLLRVLAGLDAPARGQVRSAGSVVLVPQRLTEDEMPAQLSPGEARRQALERAFGQTPSLLLLDEPTRDLDATGVQWLVDRVKSWQDALLVVSHDRRLLDVFEQFFVVAEVGCQGFEGSFGQLIEQQRDEASARERRYLSGLAKLNDEEENNAKDARRRLRKKNGGRVRELKRRSARAVLNSKRSYAQESQAKRSLLQQQRIAHLRELAKATRRALAVQLPLSEIVPAPSAGTSPVVSLQGVGAEAQGRTLFADVELSLSGERLAIVGPNASGKTTLVEIIAGRKPPTQGRALVDPTRLSYVAQNASNWALPSSLLEELQFTGALASEDAAAQLLAAHEFPLALAARPLASLSPGERVRAALICSFAKSPTPRLLVLDEPTDDLDFVAVDALSRVLCAWQGGLVVVSHDAHFLASIRIAREIDLGSAETAANSDAFLRVSAR